jgi:ssDNA-binding Zn-finger/Zn-ribbon topoisomerase 1
MTKDNKVTCASCRYEYEMLRDEVLCPRCRFAVGIITAEEKRTETEEGLMKVCDVCGQIKPLYGSNPNYWFMCLDCYRKAQQEERATLWQKISAVVLIVGFLVLFGTVIVSAGVALYEYADDYKVRRRASPYCKSTSSNQFQYERCLDYASQNWTQSR